jgi:hypothetical protein
VNACISIEASLESDSKVSVKSAENSAKDSAFRGKMREIDPEARHVALFSSSPIKACDSVMLSNTAAFQKGVQSSATATRGMDCAVDIVDREVKGCLTCNTNPACGDNGFVNVSATSGRVKTCQNLERIPRNSDAQNLGGREGTWNVLWNISDDNFRLRF